MEHNTHQDQQQVASPANIVISVDNSTHSEFAFNYYIKEIHRPGYRLHVVHCSEAWAHLASLDEDNIHDLKLKEDSKIKQMKEKFTKLMEENNVEGEFHILGGKDTWHKVIEYQHNVNAIMIVVGSRGLNAIRRTFMGSVSDSIVHHASCPVLVCRHS